MADHNEKDLEILKNCNRWPVWPVMPVKRPNRTGNGWPDMGVVLAAGVKTDTMLSHRFTVYLDVDLCKLGKAIHTILTGEHKCYIKYDSYEAMLADGWMVD